MGSRFQLAGMFSLALLACGGNEGTTPRTSAKPSRRRIVALTPPSPASYWKGLDLSYDPDVVAPPLPIDEADLVREEGAAPLFANLSAVDRASLLREGFVIVKPERARPHMGAFYMDLEEGRAPIVLTVDALAELAHLGISSAITEAHADAERPALLAWLARVQARLVSERTNCPSDLAAPYRMALGFVSVAQALGDSTYIPPADTAVVVARELASVAHPSIAKSAVFGARVDYRAFPAEPELRFRAWLALAPFSLGSEEGERAHVDIARARTTTRAALLLARATDPRVDRDAADAFAHARAIELFLSGIGDDLDLATLAVLAPKVGIDLTDGQSIANVVLVDKLRKLARHASAPKVMQGEGDGRSIRAFAAPAPLDSVAMQQLVTPNVPLRSMPTALDVAAWLGSEEARREISRHGDDKLAGYTRSLSSLFSERPRDLHASVYESSLDAVAKMLAPSVSMTAAPAFRSQAFARAVVDSAVSTWTTFRGDFSGISHARLQAPPPSASAPPNASPSLVYVEPRIEAIASLTALVRQTLGGLDALHAFAGAAPARAALRDVDELLTISFEVALLAADDELPTPTQRAELAALPAWMDSLETSMGSTTTRSVVVHVDRAQDLDLVESTLPVSAIYLALREPATKRLILAVGAHIPHEEHAVSTPKSP